MISCHIYDFSSLEIDTDHKLLLTITKKDDAKRIKKMAIRNSRGILYRNVTNRECFTNPLRQVYQKDLSFIQHPKW